MICGFAVGGDETDLDKVRSASSGNLDAILFGADHGVVFRHALTTLKVVVAEGFAPPTRRLSSACSTAELRDVGGW